MKAKYSGPAGLVYYPEGAAAFAPSPGEVLDVSSAVAESMAGVVSPVATKKTAAGPSVAVPDQEVN